MKHGCNSYPEETEAAGIEPDYYGVNPSDPTTIPKFVDALPIPKVAEPVTSVISTMSMKSI